MKTLMAVLFFSLAAHATPPSLAFKSTIELKAMMDARAHRFATPSSAEQELAPSLHAGQRAYEWINLLNKSRAAGQKPLSYSDPSTTTSPSMEKPKIYNLAIAKQQYADTAATWPAWYRQAIEGTDALPTTLPVPDAEFTALGLKTTLPYDTACRWILMQEYLNYYEADKIKDMRGYYYLNGMVDRDQTLDSFAKLPVTQQTQLHDWMVDVCVNNQDEDSYDLAKCDKEVLATEQANGLKAYFSAKSVRSSAIWNAFFDLATDWVRTDITWTAADPNTLHYPFLEPTNPVILAYLRDNVEDEWKLGAWHLKMDFTTVSTPTLSHLSYQPNTTPHADTNEIVMDDNEPLTEYLAQWTIRHEFGHLLGFKDCYVEYYDTKLQAMVNYPIDPTNLMCSRRGHLQPQHFEVLKAAYLR